MNPQEYSYSLPDRVRLLSAVKNWPIRVGVACLREIYVNRPILLTNFSGNFLPRRNPNFESGKSNFPDRAHHTLTIFLTAKQVRFGLSFAAVQLTSALEKNSPQLFFH